MKHIRLISIMLALLLLLAAGTAYAATSGTTPTCNQHTWSEWIPEPSLPTCTESGGRVRFCSVCGTSDYQPMAALGHDWRESGRSPSCEGQGTINYTCSRCGATKQESLPPQGHAFSETGRKAPTCVDQGYIEYTCSRCGRTERESLPATGNHQYGPWQTDEPATCKERELQRCACKVCGDKKWRYVGEPADHQWQEISRTPATCVEDGLATYTCKVCGENKEERLPATGEHTFGEWQLIQQPTRREGGTEQRVCSVCGYADYRKTDPLPYDVDNLILSVVQTSEQKELYQPGDTISFDIALTNGSSFDYADSRVNCMRNESVQPEDNFDICQVDALAQGETVNGTMTYTVTEEDLARGCVVLPFVGIAYFPEGFTPALPEMDMPGYEGIPTVSNSEMIYFVFHIGSGREPLEAALSLTVQQTSLQKAAYKPGDAISFELTLTNISGYTLQEPRIERQDAATYEGAEALAPGQSVTAADQYTVTAEDAQDGVITLTWSGSAALDMTSGVPFLRTLRSGAISPAERVYAAPVTLDLGYKDPDGFDSLSLQLQVSQSSENKAVYQPGDVLEFNVTVGNGSTVYVREPQAYEGSLNTGEEVDRCAWSLEMAPGAIVTGTTTYTVTQEDAERGTFALEWTGGAALCEADWPNLDPAVYDPHTIFVIPEPVMLVFAASDQPPMPPADSGLYLEGKQTSEIKPTYAEGDTVVFDLILTNTGTSTLYNPVIFNGIEAYSFEGAFAPGEQHILGYQYTITEQDAKTYAVLIPFFGRAYTAQFGAATAGQDTVDSNGYIILLPVGTTPPEPVPEPNPVPGEPVLALTVQVKDPKETYEVVDQETETITYDITVQNVGNGPCELIDIRMADSGGNTASVALSPVTLYPGQQFNTTQDWYYFRSEVIPGTASETILGEVGADFVAYGQPFDAPTLGGQIQSNTASVRHKLTEALPTGWVIPPVTLPSSVSVVKEIISLPKDSAGYQPSETICFKIYVTNTSGYTLTNVEVHDNLCVVFSDHGDNTGGLVEVIPTLLPGETHISYYNYTVQEKDTACQYISNAGLACWPDPDSEEPVWSISNVVYANVIPTVTEIIIPPNNPRPDPEPERNPKVIVQKWIEGGPANGHYYVPGEIIHYHVMAYNDSGYTLRNVKAFDDLAIDRPDCQIYSAAELDPYSWTEDMAFDYEVTEYDAAVVGHVFNEAMVTAEDVYGMVFYFWSNPTQVPAGVDDPEGSVSLVKVETSTPKEGSYYTPGEVITYDLILHNNTDHTIYMVDVFDILADDFSLPPYIVTGLEKLEAKSSQTIPFAYTVTDDDADIYGYVYNIAYVTYNDVEDGPLDPQHFVVSNDVISPAGRPGTTTDGGGGGGKNNGKPQPKPVGKLNLTNSAPDCCTFTLLDEGTYASDTKLHICARHAPIAAQADELLAQAEDKAEAWKQIAALWRAEIDEQYQELLKAAQNSIARSAVLEDQSAFIAYLGTLRAQLEQINPDDAETINYKLAILCRNHCAELCYELNMSNTPRADSLRSGGYIRLTDTIPAAECQREEASLAGADLQYRLSLCADHGPVEEGAAQLLKDAKTQGDAALAGQRAQRMWQQSLDAMTNLHYKQASKEERSIIAVNRTTFDLLLAKRRALLEMIYPSHPEIVSELMMQIVKDNVIFLCDAW